MARRQTKKQKAAEMIMPPDEHHADTRIAARYADQNSRIATVRNLKEEVARVERRLTTTTDRQEIKTMMDERAGLFARLAEVTEAINEFEKEEE